MEDRDGKKPFIIPKTHASNKDVLIPQKIESRNVIELFDDIKSCSLQLHYDFRQNQCKSCDIIRNPKLQKLYNERKIRMKKEHEPTERIAFHLITSRTTALSIATDGLSSEQLTFPIEKYLGNPKDGIHLSRRPDVVLASSGAQGLYSFGLLVCKILLGKGYATIPSINNKQLPAQLHYDYHFCKIQSVNKEQDHINDILAHSLIFCYEHEDFQTRSHPGQILPLAILWYDLTEKFPPELTPITQPAKPKSVAKKKSIPPVNTTGTWDKPIQKPPNPPPVQITPTKYPNQCLIPLTHLYTSFGSSQTDSPSMQKVSASETIPLSPSKSIQDHLSPSFKRTINEKQLLPKDIPLNNSSNLIDPRLTTLKPTHQIFYLESKAVKRVRQQQKRLNQYCDSSAKTHYALIPFHIRSISSDEYEQKNFSTKTSPSLMISVIDCLQFGLKTSANQSCIDLDTDENQIAYQQIHRSNVLIEQERDLNSQEIRLHLREKRQRKVQEHIYQQKKNDLPNVKTYMQNGRKLLKEHQQTNPSKKEFSVELLDFFSYEYQHENRPYVKRILAELIGIFIEKYGLNYAQLISKIAQVPLMTSQPIDTVIGMDLDPIVSQGLGDRDERFPVHTPPMTEPIIIQPPPIEISHEPPNTDSTISTNEKSTETSSEEINMNITNDPPKEVILPSLLVKNEENSNDSRDQFVKVLTQEAFTSQSPTSTLSVSPRRQSASEDDENENQSDTNEKVSSTRTVILVSNHDEDNLIINTTNTTPSEETEEEESEPTVKRIKFDLISPETDPEENNVNPSVDDHDYRHDLDERRQSEENSRSHTSSNRESNSKPLPSNNQHYKPTPPPSSQRRYESNRSHKYQQRSKANLPRHQRFNYNHQSVADHARFSQSSSSTNLNYHSFSTSTYSQNQNVNSTYYNDCPFYQDNYINNYQQPPPLMLPTPLMNYSNNYELKPSETIERSQTFSNNPNSSSSSENSNHYQWSSSGYPSRTTSNHQSFTRHDAEQLLDFVHRYRH